MNKTKRRALGGLHLLLVVYSLCDVCSKMAAGYPFLSLGFCLYYGGMIALLGIYSIAWQQVIKHLPLTTAYANRAATVVWGIVWGALIFHERITPGKLVGAALIIAGVWLFARAEEEEGGTHDA